MGLPGATGAEFRLFSHDTSLTDTQMCFFLAQVTYVFAHKLTGGTFPKHPGGNSFKSWTMSKLNIVTHAVDLLSKGVFIAVDHGVNINVLVVTLI